MAFNIYQKVFDEDGFPLDKVAEQTDVRSPHYRIFTSPQEPVL